MIREGERAGEMREEERRGKIKGRKYLWRRWRERWWDREWQQLERGRKGAKARNRERWRRGREVERENVFNYSALPVFSIYGPFRAASRSYIYTYCRARAAPLSTAHQGSFSPQKTGETRRKTWLHIDKRNALRPGMKLWCGWLGGKTRIRNRHGDVRWERETEGEVKLKLSFRFGYSSVTALRPKLLFFWQGNCNKKSNFLETTFQGISLIEMSCWVCVRGEEREVDIEERAPWSRSVSFNCGVMELLINLLSLTPRRTELQQCGTLPALRHQHKTLNWPLRHMHAKGCMHEYTQTYISL